MRLEKISKSEGSRNASTLTLLSELFIFAEGGEGDRVGQMEGFRCLVYSLFGAFLSLARTSHQPDDIWGLTKGMRQRLYILLFKTIPCLVLQCLYDYLHRNQFEYVDARS